MQLGAFSISLAVANIEVSKAFYEKLGFQIYAGDLSQNWLIMKNGESNVGLFQGMLEKNTLTFNPGWDNDAYEIEEFSDVREIQRLLRDRDVEIISEADENTTGPGSLIVVDPDGNPILLDQHV